MRKIILFELNEVPLRVIDYYANKKRDSTLARILPISSQFETFTQDEGHLHPWTTWPTLHRGVSNKVHKIKDLGEDLSETNNKFPNFWDILVKQNISTGIFSSLHTYPLPDNLEQFDYYVPDPFAAGSEVKPKKIQPFQAFNLMMSRASARNVSRKLKIGSGAILLSTLLQTGVRLKTFSALAEQLMVERVSPWKATRRRTHQAALAFDIFFNLLKTNKPQFTTFFSNHVASTMHRYWAATFPEDFDEITLGEDWIEKYSKEIDFAMDKFDSFLSRIVSFVDKNPEYKLILASSMGQKATKALRLETELIVEDLKKLMSAFLLKEDDWQALPAMHPQYNLRVKTPQVGTSLEKILADLTIDDDPINYRKKEGGFFSLDFGQVNLQTDSIKLGDKTYSFREVGLKNEKIQEEASGTAYHIPEGCMLVYDPLKKSGSERQFKINTIRIAPSILKNFNIQTPEYMTTDLIPEI